MGRDTDIVDDQRDGFHVAWMEQVKVKGNREHREHNQSRDDT